MTNMLKDVWFARPQTAPVCLSVSQPFSERGERVASRTSPRVVCESMSAGLDPDFLYHFLISERLSGDFEACTPKSQGVIAPIVRHQLLAAANECYINWKTDFLNPLTFL